MPIDIDRLTEAELIDFNNRVVALVKFLIRSCQPARRGYAQFSIGERVSFQSDGQPLLTGIIAKYNRKLGRPSSPRTGSSGTWRRVPAQGRAAVRRHWRCRAVLSPGPGSPTAARRLPQGGEPVAARGATGDGRPRDRRPHADRLRPAPTPPFDGGCACGHVRYRLLDWPCSCTAATAPVPARDRRTVRASRDDRVHPLLAHPRGGRVRPGADRQRGQALGGALPRCKTAMWNEHGTRSAITRYVRVGTLDTPDALPPLAHISTFDRSRRGSSWATRSGVRRVLRRGNDVAGSESRPVPGSQGTAGTGGEGAGRCGEPESEPEPMPRRSWPSRAPTAAGPRVGGSQWQPCARGTRRSSSTSRPA